MSITEGAYSCILRLVCGFGYNLESNGNSSIVIVDSRDLDCGGPCFFVIAVSDFIVRTGSQLLLTKSDCCFWFDRGSGVGIAFSEFRLLLQQKCRRHSEDYSFWRK